MLFMDGELLAVLLTHNPFMVDADGNKARCRKITALGEQDCDVGQDYSSPGRDGVGAGLGAYTQQSSSTHTSRRQTLQRLMLSVAGGVATTTWTTAAESASAASPPAVRAPKELLRPATRVQLYIDKAIALGQEAKQKKTNSSETAAQLLDPLRQHLLGSDDDGNGNSNQPVFLTPEEEQLSKRYLQIDTSSAWQAARLKEREARGAEKGIDYTTPYDKVNTAIQQWGDKRQFKILRARQRGLEQSNGMRAAFNSYTNNLVFGDAYQLNVDGDEKKAMVRNDALPNVNSVVVSDLDLRDLYRNEVLQNMDNAKAELEYQIKSSEVDIDEILSYLIQAKVSCDKWFSFIPREDVDEVYQSIVGATS